MTPNSDALAGYDSHTDLAPGSTLIGNGVSGPDRVNAPYTWDQIANYLTNGYWGFNGASWRAFDLGATRTITYNASHLSPLAQGIVEYSLDVWAAVTGINFVDVSANPTSFTETFDVSGSTAGAASIGTNTVVSGSIGTVGDADYYRISLVAGQTYMFSLSRAGGSTIDPVLDLRNSFGVVVASADDPSNAAAGEYITFTASSSGTYYLVARDFGNRTGSYELTTQVAADLTFNDADATGAYAWSETTGNRILRSFINIEDSWDLLTLNSYMQQTYIHEIGHALGLGHGGPYNGSANWGSSHRLYDNDSWSSSVMSYFDQSVNTFDPSDFAYLATIMPADIIAIQNLYGAGSIGYQTGNTVWGPGGNVGGYFQLLLNMWGGLIPRNSAIYVGNDFAFTIYDTGGTDTLDVSVFGQNQLVNLTELQRSNIGGVVGNVVIARGTVIENATTGAGNDTIHGNNVANVIRSGAGNDQLYGGGGDDILIGGAGADRLDGGAGRDRADYSDATAAVRVDLISPAVNTGFAAGDVFVSIEDLQGSGYNDTLMGDNIANAIWGGNGNDQILGRGGNDTLYGGAGNDILIGGAGADRLDGGTGRDRVEYSDATAAVKVDLVLPASNTGFAAGDTFVSIEDILGSTYNDTLIGDNLANAVWGGLGDDYLMGRGGNDSLYGGVGNDTLIGGAGADLLDGGAGRDRVQYNDATTGVRVDMIAPTSNTGFAQGDTLVNVEEISGSNHNDTLSGDNLANGLWGLSGNDYLFGRGGNDSLYGGDGNDTLVGGAGADRLDGGAGRDRVQYNDATTGVKVDLVLPGTNTGIAAGDTFVSIEDIYGSNHNDTLHGDNGANAIWGAGGADFLMGRAGNDSLYGDAGDDILVGGAGADRLDGGAGRDRAQYNDATSGVRVDLISPAANTGFAAGDTYISIEDLAGSAHNDILLADNADNWLWGLNGNDQLYGRGGNDSIYGGNGNDSLYGGDGNDVLQGGVGADLLDGGAGRDRAQYSDAAGAVRVSLLNPAINTGDAAGDTFVSIEDIFGSRFNDTIAGDNAANALWGAAGNDNLSGNGGNDTIYGGDGNDTIRGGDGNDMLYGGAGADVFIFDRPIVGVSNIDRLLDFSSVDDSIWLDDAIFTALSVGALAANAFHIGAAATSAAHRIIYNQTTGALFYDADGNGAGAARQFATLNAGTTLVLSDFVVI
ncbi:hypothetical protein HOY34_02350 [Xinfangfangia sp. D13-10-4-6]|uniref:M10 family metallopeptidase C-terminal domain-containing protein n=1 Tax=Pseudogemmobacter hezensis TaxID=2737662 RepID=UPI0015550B8C|nr:M10 family metallopeptidase C-terminal domain-containing protein [Pseudogemmobacter hezensis]NPD14038.1 hypothetical protein [Pseudogemmobacter hezensis]